MAGLLLAEVGGSMVEINKHSGALGSGFTEGRHIEPGIVTPIGEAKSDSILPSSVREPKIQSRLHTEHRRGMSLDRGLARHGTLLSSQASPTRHAAELKVLLGDSSAKVKSGAVVSSLQGSSKKSLTAVAFEQGRSRVRVALDLVLENNIAVEGGYISGCILIRVRPKAKGDVLSLGGGKIRVAGFEVSPGNEDRHIFYQVAAPLTDVSDGCVGLYSSSVDREGFGTVNEGDYRVRFALNLPVVNTGGRPKGFMISRSGAAIRYIVIVSMRVVDPSTSKRSIAHFYRDCVIWPALDPVVTLAAAQQPIYARAAKKLFMGGDGTLAVSAALHRLTWVAGQPMHVRVQIVNDTRKSVRNVALSLIRTTTIFHPSIRTGGFSGDQDACETETSERRVAEAVLVAGQKGAKGRASARGWWTGVGPGESMIVGHSIVIPTDELTIQRARLLEVEYTLRVSLGVGSITGSSDAVHVVLPIRVVNFVSLDPPPSGPVLPASMPSIIELNTPKPGVHQTYPDAERMRSHRSTRPQASSVRVSAKGKGISESGDVFKHMYPDSRFLGDAGVSPPIRLTSHMLHDLGGMEDADDLHGLLGEIPGSVSVLEKTNIAMAADPGYSEGEFNGYVYAGDCDRHDDSRGQGRQEYDSHSDYDAAEDCESDEELERVVGRASAQPDAGAFQAYGLTAPYDRAGRAHEYTRAQLCASNTEYDVNATNGRTCSSRSEYTHEASRARPVQGTAHDVRAQNSRRYAAASPRRNNFAERVRGERACEYLSPERRPEPEIGPGLHAGGISSLSPVLHIPDNSSCLLYETPLDYLAPAPAQMSSSKHAPVTRKLGGGPSKLPAQRRRPQDPRPAAMRASTTPSNSTHELSRFDSALYSLPTSTDIYTLPSSNSTMAGSGMNAVQARIAMLEQKTREQVNSMSSSRPVVVSRSITTDSIPAVSYYAYRK
ncbi:hypothetical protein M0805_009244 [Coniferiporia weirii]|nr:hypothetical protein M0805_009244 [Coniferiporia weirii]